MKVSNYSQSILKMGASSPKMTTKQFQSNKYNANDENDTIGAFLFSLKVGLQKPYCLNIVLQGKLLHVCRGVIVYDARFVNSA